MTRQDIRDLKRAVSQECSTSAMLILLQRSIRFGHKKLALIRCIQAERLGIVVPQDILDYCHGVAANLPCDVLKKVVRHAASTDGAVR